MNDYDVYSEFNLAEHNKHYTNYCEVVISPRGTVEYAVPSHAQKLIDITCKKLNLTVEELNKLVPPEFYFDMLDWLCMKSGYVAVWTDGGFVGVPNRFQMHKLKELAASGACGDIDETVVSANKRNLNILLGRSFNL